MKINVGDRIRFKSSNHKIREGVVRRIYPHPTIPNFTDYEVLVEGLYIDLVYHKYVIFAWSPNSLYKELLDARNM